MTIAFGVKCSDGILLASDTEYSAGDIKYPGPKIFIAPLRNNFHFAVTGSGDVPVIKMACEEINARIEEPSSIEEVKQVIKSVISEIYKKHIFPTQARFSEFSQLIRWGDLFLIIGVCWKDRHLDLINTQGTIVNSMEHNMCTGIGSSLSNTLVEPLFSGIHSVDDAKFVAVYIVNLVKKNIRGCGERTTVILLRKDGTIEQPAFKDVERMEELFDAYADSLRSMFMLLNPEHDMRSFETFMKHFVGGFKKFKRRQIKNPISPELYSKRKDWLK